MGVGDENIGDRTNGLAPCPEKQGKYWTIQANWPGIKNMQCLELEPYIFPKGSGQDQKRALCELCACPVAPGDGTGVLSPAGRAMKSILLLASLRKLGPSRLAGRFKGLIQIYQGKTRKTVTTVRGGETPCGHIIGESSLCRPFLLQAGFSFH